MLELIGTITTILAVTGVVLNNRRKRACFMFWLVSNAMSMIIHAQTGVWSLAVRDLIFIVLAIEGWYLWKSNSKP